MKYSHQRELVKEIVKNRCDHPTADMVYWSAREKEPSISLGTVYRNLKSLTDSGEIDTLETVDKRLHYDGNTKRHCHFICEKCGAIYDIWQNATPPEELLKMGCEIKETKSIYYGLCKNCIDKK